MKKILGFTLGLGLATAASASPVTEAFQLRGENAQADLFIESDCEFGQVMVFAADQVVHLSGGPPSSAPEMWVDYWRTNWCEGFDEYGGGWTDMADFGVSGQLKGANLTASLEIYVERWSWGGFPGEGEGEGEGEVFPIDEEPPPPDEPPPAPEAPEGWICAPEWYGSADGCDCGCGVVDPDCADPADVGMCDYQIPCWEQGTCADPADPTQCLDPELAEGVCPEVEPPPPPPPPPGSFVTLDLDVTWLGFGDTYRGMNMWSSTSRSGHYMSRSVGSNREADVSAVLLVDGNPIEPNFGWGMLGSINGNSLFHVSSY